MNNMNNYDIINIIKINIKEYCNIHKLKTGTNSKNTLTGNFYIDEILNVINNKTELSNILMNYFTIDFDYENIRNRLFRFLNTILDFNNLKKEDLKKFIKLFNENYVNEMTNTQLKKCLESCKNIYELIHRNNKYNTLDTNRITQIKVDKISEFETSCSKNWVLNLLNNRDYIVWLNPLIEKFINENINI